MQNCPIEDPFELTNSFFKLYLESEKCHVSAK